MLHPAHLHPAANVDPQKLAWLAWWREERSELVNQRNRDVIAGLGAAFGFGSHYVGGPNWGAFLLGCIFLVLGGYFFYHRRTDTAVQDWDAIGQLPYQEQCAAAREKLDQEGKPGWFNIWLIAIVPMLLMLTEVDTLQVEWTERMTFKLVTWLLFGIAMNFFNQGRRRRQWQEGMDLATRAGEAS